MELKKIFNKPENGLFFGTCYNLGKKYNINPIVLRAVFTIPSILFIFPIIIYTIITLINVYVPRTINVKVIKLFTWLIIILVLKHLTNNLISALLYVGANYIQ